MKINIARLAKMFLFTLLTLCVLAMLVAGALHALRYPLCQDSRYTQLNLCLYPAAG
ncbi:MAG: hypothetical protein AB7G80_05465 [Dongiaceae bacterium]